MVSRGGGSAPVWASDRELLFRRGPEVYSARVTVSGDTFESDAPVRVPTPQPLSAGETVEVLPDGRLLLIQSTPRPLPTLIALVTGWIDELNARLPRR